MEPSINVGGRHNLYARSYPALIFDKALELTFTVIIAFIPKF
jgi:hypothetical protein